MSAQTKASEIWRDANNYRVRKAKIDSLLEQAMDYTYPAGQTQAGLQMANVEVPWLLGYIEELKEQIAAQRQAAA
jgi:hypothetical protein